MRKYISGHIIQENDVKLPLVSVEITSTIKKKTISYVGWVDSGATSTVLSRKIAEDLDFVHEGQITSSTPTDDDVIHDTKLVKIKVHGTDGTFIEDSISTPILKKNLSDCDLLIGLDILKHARFEYNGKKNTFLLSFT